MAVLKDQYGDSGKAVVSTSSGLADVVSLVDSAGLALGGQSGITGSVNFTPAAAAYGAADVMSVAQEISFTYSSSGLAVPAGSLLRILSTSVRIDITSVPATQTSYTLHVYSVTPPSAQADNDLWALASADLPSYRGSINLGTPVDLGAALHVETQYVDKELRLAAGLTSVFGVLVTVGAHTATAVARQIVLRGVVL